MRTQQHQVHFFKQMAQRPGQLETLARKELATEPFIAEEQAWLKKTIDRRGFGSGPPRNDGWHCDLYVQDFLCSYRARIGRTAGLRSDERAIGASEMFSLT